MYSRRKFLHQTGLATIGTIASPILANSAQKNISKNAGVQLYSVRTEMLVNALATLQMLAKIGYKQIESARSEKGNYYGLSAKEIKSVTNDLGLTLQSGHVHIDDHWQKSIEDAVIAGQQYLICSTMPTGGQTVDNYQRVAEKFNIAGDQCKAAGLKFGYHNHDYEFDTREGQVLYDVLLNNTDPKLVHMELDLGWVVVTGNKPADYFARFPGRFPLWHLKDMLIDKRHSTEFGKGQLDIAGVLQLAKQAGMQYYFVEQEEYEVNATQSLRHDFDYLHNLG